LVRATKDAVSPEEAQRKSDNIFRRKDRGLTGRELPRLFFIVSSQAIEGRSCLIVIDRDSKTAPPPGLFTKHRGAFARGYVDQHIDGADELAMASKSGVGNGTKSNRVPSGRSATGHAPYGRLRQDRFGHRTLVVRKECAIFGVS
jgi:hypothetical protein